MIRQRLCGALIGTAFGIIVVAEARGNSVASGLAFTALVLTHYVVIRSAA